jgi:hypothetical protein
MFAERRAEALARAYPGIPFRTPSHGWLARFMRAPAECSHLEVDQSWMATFAPDTLYLRGKARRPTGARPEVSLCRACLKDALLAELRAYRGRVVAFEPDAGAVTQYFFLDRADFQEAGLLPETAQAIEQRLETLRGQCQHAGCSRAATWLWLSRSEVESLDHHEAIGRAIGRTACALHGAELLCGALAAIPEANLLYINVPYGEQGAYVWV